MSFKKDSTTIKDMMDHYKKLGITPITSTAPDIDPIPIVIDARVDNQPAHPGSHGGLSWSGETMLQKYAGQAMAEYIKILPPDTKPEDIAKKSIQTALAMCSQLETIMNMKNG